MKREAINELKKYTLGKKNTEKIEISVLALNRVIFALEQEPILDKIRAEIEQVAEEENKVDKKWAQGLKYALKIIDKYNRESEG